MNIWQNLYRAGTDLGAPAVDALLRRLRGGKEDPVRIGERRGVPAARRPAGRLVWCHAASVGEMMSVLLLLERLGERLPHAHFLLTTGTVTSARMAADRLPPRTLHQYVPVDRMPWVRRFFDHWRPDAALWLESELWPNLLAELRARRIPAALVNARMSAGSLRRWHLTPGWARALLGAFRLCLAQTADGAADFRALAHGAWEFIGNLKYATQPLPHDAAALQAMQSAIGSRPCWLMASTHPGEEGMALAAHEELRRQFPDLFTMIAPRHPARGADVAAMLARHGIHVARRSLHQPIAADTGIYLADTLGEMGLLFRLAPVVLHGGTFAPVGGHNPIEPAWLGCAVICGPDMRNFSEVAAQMHRAGGLLRVCDGAAMQQAIAALLADPARRQTMAQAALGVAESNRHVLERTVEALLPVLDDAEAQP